MDPAILFIIITIVVVVFLLTLYKQQENRVTGNLHNDNLKQLLTLNALEHKFSHYSVNDDDDSQSITNQITLLISTYEKGNINTDAFQKQMDYLLNQLN
jgi:hypothetical protein